MQQTRRGGAASLMAGMAALSLLTLAAGCTPEARQDVGKAGDNLSSAVDKSAQGTATALEKAGSEAKDASKDAVTATKRDAGKAGDNISATLKDASTATKEAAAPVVLTPKVRQAIVDDKRFEIKDLNVDTRTADKKVIIMGFAPSDTARTQAIDGLSFL